MQEQKINITLFLTACALACTRAINRHYRIRWIHRETNLRVQGLRIFLIASALAGTRAINRHYRIRWIQRETDLRVQGAYIISRCQGTSSQKYTQTLNSQIALSQIDRT